VIVLPVPVTALLATLVLVAAQSTAVAAGLLALERVAPRRWTHGRRALAALALAKFAVPAWVAWPLLPAAGADAAAATTPRLPVDVALAGLAVWTLVALVALVRLAVARVALGRRLARATPCEDPNARAALRAAARRAGLARVPRLLESGETGAPFAAGTLDPAIVLPAGWSARLALEDLATVLLHEAIHVRRRDVLRLELASWLVALWWWNPVCHWAARRWRALVEDACDDAVLDVGGLDPRGYCSALLRAARLAVNPRTPDPAGAAGIGLHELERRLRRLAAGAHGGRRGGRAAVAVLCAGAVIVLPHWTAPGAGIHATPAAPFHDHRAAPGHDHPGHDHAAHGRGHVHTHVLEGP
jgi:bla regulator protein blaR1